MSNTGSTGWGRATAGEGDLWHLFVRDLVLPARLGVHAHERQGPRLVRLSLDLAVRKPSGKFADSIEAVLDYQALAESIRALLNDAHINLIETMAERIASLCLDDVRVARVRVRVEKPGALPDATAVGAEIERAQTSR
ncbi:MAG: dihydroneopterin aldolase [Alphaproteobacteria bacterium]|nr:dihydroneopterin aldolase [Alphaproteobacteria bacterium]